MTKEELISQASRISNNTTHNIRGSFTEAKEFLRTYAGPDNSFSETLAGIPYGASDGYLQNNVRQVLNSFIEYVKSDLLRAISLEREIQIDTVSDYIEQAENLLNDKKVHPAAPAVIVGASLEEFLRNWLEEIGVDINSMNRNLDTFAKELRSKELISKQDLKDITSWGGIRNDAAHGHWENVEDRNRIRLMLEGVNLFIRKYSE